MIAMMERKKSELGSWQLIKPTAPCKPHFYLIHQSKQPNKTLRNIKPIFWYCSVTWTLSQTAEQMLKTFERKILRRIYGGTQEWALWSGRSSELYSLYNERNNVEDIKIIRLGLEGHIMRMEEERSPKIFKRKILHQNCNGETKN